MYIIVDIFKGGTLWQYVHNYLQSADSATDPLFADGSDNIYSGKKYTTSATDHAGNYCYYQILFVS